MKRLASRGETLAIAEVGSGGSLIAGFSGAASAEHALVGAYVAPTEEKLQELLGVSDETWGRATSSTQRTKILARTAAALTGSQWALAVGETQRDETGARFVEVVFKTSDGQLEGRQVRLRGDAAAADSRLTTQLLDDLRRRVK